MTDGKQYPARMARSGQAAFGPAPMETLAKRCEVDRESGRNELDQRIGAKPPKWLLNRSAQKVICRLPWRGLT
jgi:hypothetical protein